MKAKIALIIFSIFILTGGCITPFMPDIEENQELLVVEGLITDQPEANTVRLSLSMPLGQRLSATPVSGAVISIFDDLGKVYNLVESKKGTYQTNPSTFRGVAGRKYRLHIKTKGTSTNYYTYESVPMEMKPVPPIDSIYYEKVVISGPDLYSGLPKEGCQIYMDTEDKENNCRFFRWNYTETWEFRIPFEVPNNRCWVSEASSNINIKSTSALAQSRINRFPIKYVSNSTDRLKVKYSILIQQYSLSEDEFIFWDKMKNIYENVGSLYDMIPAAIPGNIYCVENPKEKVLGYFSVSSTTSKRIFIKDNFFGQADPYRYCITDTIFGGGQIPGLNSYVWILYDHSFPPPAYRVITDNKGCADCTVRGTNKKPAFWE